MRKQALIHLHGLLVELTKSLVDRGEISPEIWDAYHELDVDAYAFDAPKEEHRTAVLVLANAIASELEQPAERNSAVSAP